MSPFGLKFSQMILHTETSKLMYNWSFLFEVLHKPTLLPSTFKVCYMVPLKCDRRWIEKQPFLEKKLTPYVWETYPFNALYLDTLYVVSSQLCGECPPPPGFPFFNSCRSMSHTHSCTWHNHPPQRISGSRTRQLTFRKRATERHNGRCVIDIPRQFWHNGSHYFSHLSFCLPNMWWTLPIKTDVVFQ